MNLKWSSAAAVAVIGVLTGLAWGQCDPVKWSQEPVKIGEWEGFPLFIGWYEESVYYPQMPRVAAADWQCNEPNPVRDLHIWGSYIGWAEPQPPPAPHGFRITFWDDMPVGADPYWPDVWYSHPDQLIHQVWTDTFDVQFLGWSVDPCEPNTITDAFFKYEVVFEPAECFFQQPGNIYWVSVSADYGDLQPSHPWAWNNRKWDEPMIEYGLWGNEGADPAVYADWWCRDDPCEAGPPYDLCFTLTMAIDGDANLDGVVDGLDYNAWSLHYNQPGGWTGGDFNGSGFVDGLDYNLWSLNYGCPRAGEPVPEPASAALLILGCWSRRYCR